MDLYSLPVHPAAQLFPLMQGDDLRELVDDVKKNGLRIPIVVFDKMGERSILDGRNRLEACKIAGIEPEYKLWVGADPIAYVTSANLHRRHLVDSQLAILAVNIERLYAAEAKKRTGGRPSKGQEKPVVDRPPVSREGAKSRAKAAAQVGVSPSLVQRAKKVITTAAPEVTAAVQAGKITLNDAIAIVDQPATMQVELVAKVEEGEARTLAEALKAMQPDESTAPASTVAAPAEAAPIAEVEAVWSRVTQLSRAALAELHARLGRFLEIAA